MEMWRPDDTGRDSWDWVGPPAWERACFNSPEWGGGSSPVKTEPLPDCIVVVEWLYYSKRIILLDGLTLAIFFRSFSSVKCVFCFTSNENCHFSSENDYTPKRVVDFHLERDTFRNKIMEIV